MATARELFERRRLRLRSQLHKKRGGRPRLSVHRTRRHIYAQVIDDTKNETLTAASTLDESLRSKNGGNVDAAQAVGKMIAERAKKAGIDKVVFDRGGYIYHGRVRALAEAAREGGLDF